MTHIQRQIGTQARSRPTDRLLWVGSEMGLAGCLEEAAFDPGIERCSGVGVRVRAGGRRSIFGKGLEVRNGQVSQVLAFPVAEARGSLGEWGG